MSNGIRPCNCTGKGSSRISGTMAERSLWWPADSDFGTICGPEIIAATSRVMSSEEP